MTTLTDKLFGRERRELKIVFALVVLTLSAVLLYPLGCVLFQSILDGNGSLTLANYTSLLSEPRFWNALSNSFAVSGLSAVIAAVLAFGCAYGLHFTRLNPWAKKVFQIVILLPLFLPSITYGFAVIYSFGRLGLVSQVFGVLPFSIYGFWGLLIADVIYTLPPAFLILSNAFHYIDRNTITVSRLMGDSPWRTFYISALRPVVGALCSAFILSFFLSFTDFGIPASVGGDYEVIATVLYNEMLGGVPDFNRGAVISVVMLLPSIVSILLLRFLERYNIRYDRISDADLRRNPGRDTAWGLSGTVLAILILCMFVVIFVVPLVERWPYQTGFTLEHFQEVFSDNELQTVYLNSLGMALATALFGTLAAYGAALITARSKLPGWCKQVIDAIALVTNTIPGMVLGLAFLFVFSGTSLQNTFPLMILCNIVHYFSTPYLMMKNALSKMNAGWETTAMLMGDSWPKTILRVVTPNAAASLIETFSYYFINSMVTISALIFLAGARTMVLTTKIKQLQYINEYDQVFVLSLLILATNLIAKAIFTWLANKSSRKGSSNAKKRKEMKAS